MRFQIQSIWSHVQTFNNRIKYRNFCDIRIKSTEGISLIKIKRAIRFSGLFELEDQNCFLRTQCPVCPVNATTASKAVDVKKHSKRSTIYINKTTGIILCLFLIE